MQIASSSSWSWLTRWDDEGGKEGGRGSAYCRGNKHGSPDECLSHYFSLSVGVLFAAMSPERVRR